MMSDINWIWMKELILMSNYKTFLFLNIQRLKSKFMFLMFDYNWSYLYPINNTSGIIRSWWYTNPKFVREEGQKKQREIVHNAAQIYKYMEAADNWR